ncbi:MAG: peptidase domain-containing ABC transporter, partial [Hyphomicrobiales bacterium]
MSTVSHTNLQCLALVARHHRVDLSPERLIHDYAIGDQPVPTRQLLRMAKDAGLRAKQAKLSWSKLFQMGQACPAMAELKNGNWVIIATANGTGADRTIQVLDPLAVRPELITLTEAQFTRSWTGSIILMKREYRLTDDDQPFGWRWFLPEIIRQRSLFRDVAIAAIILYALGLTTPIFFQLVIDKVLVHESYATLTVLVIGIGISIFFDAIFTFLRRYLLLYASNKIDIRMASRTFG